MELVPLAASATREMNDARTMTKSKRFQEDLKNTCVVSANIRIAHSMMKTIVKAA